MFDDVSHNFIMNKQNGLKIKPCRKMVVPENRAADRELADLGEYLMLIKDMPTFEELRHRKWQRFVAKHRSK